VPDAECSVLVARQRYVTGTVLFTRLWHFLLIDWQAALQRRL